MRAPLVPAPRVALLLATACLVVVLVLGLAVRGDDHGFALDDAFRRWVLRTFGTRAPADMVHLTDGWLIVAAVAAISLVALVRRRWDVAVLTVAATAVATGLTEYVLKPFFDRTVPYVQQFFDVETEAYPSGHETATSCVLAVLALLLARSHVRIRYKIGGFVLLALYFATTVVGLVGQYYHYLTDTIGALLLAVAVVLGAALLLDRVRR